MAEIARANEALAYFQIGDADQAIRRVEAVLRRDSNWWDMRVALVSFLWGAGQEARAEEEWNRLCDSDKYVSPNVKAAEMLSFGGGGGEGAPDGGSGRRRRSAGSALSPCALYTNTDIVRNRWPPRPTAAFQAFLVRLVPRGRSCRPRSPVGKADMEMPGSVRVLLPRARNQDVSRAGSALDYDGTVREYRF